MKSREEYHISQCTKIIKSQLYTKISAKVFSFPPHLANAVAPEVVLNSGGRFLLLLGVLSRQMAAYLSLNLLREERF